MTAREKEELVASLAERLEELGLAEPARLFLEGHQPLSFLASQLLIFASPFFGTEAERYAALLEDRSALHTLILQLRGDLSSDTRDKR